MPQVSTTITYPGTCLIEGTTLTEGRGTALPFEVAGAPWLDGVELAEKLNHLRLPGVLFRSTAIKPASSKHANQVCGAVQLHVTERRVFRPVRPASDCDHSAALPADLLVPALQLGGTPGAF
jgi:uncharacterized protein YbbC (DUF1343 family)